MYNVLKLIERKGKPIVRWGHKVMGLLVQITKQSKFISNGFLFYEEVLFFPWLGNPVKGTLVSTNKTI